jgi:uncharacterized protein YqeY
MEKQMTSMMKQLQNDQLTARKERNSMKATLLTTLVGEAIKVGKDDGNRESTDEEVMKTIRKFANNAKDNIRDYGKVGKADAVEQMQKELEILSSYLPAQVDEDAVRAFIAEVMQEKRLAKAPSSMKIIMAELSTKFGDSLDKKVGSAIAKEMVS